MSDLLERGDLKRDWTELRDKLDVLKPGKVLHIQCPVGMDENRFRSTILVIYKRLGKRKWMASTKVSGKTVSVFLVR